MHAATAVADLRSHAFVDAWVGLALAQDLLFRDTILFLLAWGTLLSYAVPASCAGTWLVRLLFPERVSGRVRRLVILSAVLAWLPHYYASRVGVCSRHSAGRPRPLVRARAAARRMIMPERSQSPRTDGCRSRCA